MCTTKQIIHSNDLNSVIYKILSNPLNFKLCSITMDIVSILYFNNFIHFFFFFFYLRQYCVVGTVDTKTYYTLNYVLYCKFNILNIMQKKLD